MSAHPDVLDHLGFAPREFGALHFHAGTVVVDERRQAHVTVLLQPAFQGRIHGRLLPTAVTREGERAVEVGLARELPTLEEAVLRWRLTFPLLAVPEEILFRVEAPVPAGAGRIRAAWKLLDTVEQPMEVRPLSTALMEDGGTDAFSFGAHLALGLALGHVSIPVKALSSLGSVSAAETNVLVRHAAPESLDGFLAPVVQGTAPEAAPEVEVLWRPGMELPAAPPPVRAQAAPGVRLEPRTRECMECGRDVSVAEAERERMCPNCGAPWNR